jgi:GNAT superfamily N-acetyltransferase
MLTLPITPDLLEGCVELWNRCLADSFPMRPAMLRQGLWNDPNFDAEGSQAVLEGDRVVALCAVKRQQVDLGNQPAQGKGWITAIMTDPEYRGRGIGSRLLEEARAHLARFWGEDVALGSDPSHFFPGIPFDCREALAWFARRGARLGGPACDLLNPEVQAFIHPPKALEAFAANPDVRFHPAAAADLAHVRAFMEAEFPGRWAWEMERHITLGGRPEDIMLAVERGRVIGFARIHGPVSTRFGPGTYWAPLFPGSHGGLGPIGVAAGVRGRGLGLALLSASIAELRDRRIDTAVIDWTVLVPFYGLVGFRPWRWYTMASLPALKAD